MRKSYLIVSLTFILVIASISVLAQKPFLLTGAKGNYGLPMPIFSFLDAKGRSIVLAQDGEIRWFDDVRKPPVKTAKIKEVPAFDYSPEEKKDIADLIKYHQNTFGDIPENFFSSSTLIQRPGGKEFCLTDRDSKFYFYSTETAELMRKVLIQKQKHKYGPLVTALSDDNKIVLTESTQLNKAYIHSIETGKLLFEIDTQFLDSCGLSPDGLTLFHLHKNILSRYFTKTGKKSVPDLTINSESAGQLVVSPAGSKIAFSLYTKGNYDGQAILDLATNQIMLGDPTVKRFGAKAFTPDGKFLAVYQPKYLHFIDTASGKHSFSYIMSFSEIWDNVVEISFSPDSTKMSFTHDGLDIHIPYFVYCDLSQPRKQTLDKIVIPTD